MIGALGRRRERGVSAVAFRVSIVAYLGVRAWLAVLPGYADDLDWYRRWALAAATAGPSAAYDVTEVDYPPLLLYPMWLAGEIYLATGPELEEQAVRGSRGFTALIKTPHLAFDLLLGGLLFLGVSRLGLWGRDREGPAWGRMAAVLYWWNPAVLWGSAYWGQPDGVHSAFLVAALMAAGADRPAGAGAALSAAVLTKPLAAPLAPLILLASWTRRGFRALVPFAAGAAAVAFVLFLPFLIAGRLPFVVGKVFSDLDAMPLTSVNAHNLWWLLGPWRDARVPLVGALTPKWIGLAIFAIAYAVLLVGFARGRDGPRRSEGTTGARLFLTAAAVYAIFFACVTHMHENHLYLVVPLLVAVAGRSRALATLTALASVAVFANMFLHDPSAPAALPGLLGAVSTTPDPYTGRPYTWLQWVGSHVNAVLVLGIAASTWVAAWRANRGAAA